ncbi:MAG TPA: hypothetical protein DCY53_07535 [Desulfobacteraceae bacterium]|nr:hypothetical protein [Desulfobacteraceae bacterium]
MNPNHKVSSYFKACETPCYGRQGSRQTGKMAFFLVPQILNYLLELELDRHLVEKAKYGIDYLAHLG